MKTIISGWETILNRFGIMATLIFILATPLIITILIAFVGHLIIPFGIQSTGTKMIEISNTIMRFFLENILLTPFKLIVLGSSIITAVIILIDIISPTFFVRKLLEKSSTEYVLHKLKGEHEIAQRIEKKIAQINLKLMRNQIRN
ncbi:MAG: hypothetical protein NZ927_01950 [Candidatus Calescibacterium sp.]|nr:hypothetical protein [Candidatus Calescibacterium sp.]MCX7734409.1 hypothetical protein [bacterium]MDW8086827.1 hypothetical protein [Candidatus Calescibacterium sp.]